MQHVPALRQHTAVVGLFRGKKDQDYDRNLELSSPVVLVAYHL